ncbi:MAG TPA: ATP-binding protein [Flavisolibacter sp.]|nr:ATP-binding protein [Flavisolibacter sp.]
MTYFKIAFKDNGIGFDQNYAEQIFTIFQRLNNRFDYSGSGIGLSICRKIVNHHQGKIFAESEEGKGATFYVLLPVKQ